MDIWSNFRNKLFGVTKDCSFNNMYFKEAIDGAVTAIMMVDRDFKVTYVNQKTKELLCENKSAFNEIWPDIDLDNIIGQCIDQFHKDPSHQRRLLADPSNLPFKTFISVGDLYFGLNVTAQIDSLGNYIGNTLEWRSVTELRKQEKLNAEYTSIIKAIDKSQAMIEFDMDGYILTANNLFLAITGYSRDEIIGKHHSIFISKKYKLSREYKEFWEKLNKGQFDSCDYLRFGKNGKQIWIRATYNPIPDEFGRIIKVVKIATDVTKEKMAEQETLKLLKEAQIVMSDMAKGNLTLKMEDTYTNEFNELSTSINNCSNKLIEVVDKIKNSADNLSCGISEINNENINLSDRTQSQKVAIEETSAILEELTATTKGNAGSAQQASNMTMKTQEFAFQGGKIVNDAVFAMQEINAASKKISDIIGVIDEIAFQTNLLSLNAAVEAARAGSHGRGFAVVASEIRNLACKTADSAKEIKSIIVHSVSKVEQGAELVNQSGNQLKQIQDGVNVVSEYMENIVSSSQEQIHSIQVVNDSVLEIEKAAQKNMDLVENATLTSRSFSKQVVELSEMVKYFSTKSIRKSTPQAQISGINDRDDNYIGNNSRNNQNSFEVLEFNQ